MAKMYFITDETNQTTQLVSKKDFLESIHYNREIAEEYGDLVITEKQLNKKLNSKERIDESFNGFTYKTM